MSVRGYLGVDVGGTSVSADLVGADGALLVSHGCRTGHGEDALEALRSLVGQAARDAVAHDVELEGIGVLSPGHVDDRAGVVHFAANLGWREVPLATILGRLPETAGVPLAVGHDVRWAGIAEGTFGACRDARDYAVLSLGTGIAACLAADGEVLTGSTGSAGEVGHATAVAGGDRCACGRIGCLDAYASGAGLLHRYAARRGGPGVGSVEELVARLDQDPDARAVWDEAIDALAVGLCTLVMTTDPALISLVGGMSRAGATLVDPLRERLAAEAGWKAVPPVVASPLQDVPGRAGSVLLAMTAAGHREQARSWSSGTVAAWAGAARSRTSPHEVPA